MKLLTYIGAFAILASIALATATGGTITTYINGSGVNWTVHKFLANASFNVTDSTILGVQTLIVGGGGSGVDTSWGYGGAGAGGVLYNASTTIPIGNYPVVVGLSTNLGNGQNSTFNGIIAKGGGKGTTYNGVAGDGGSGGGAGDYVRGSRIGVGIPGQGNDGCIGMSDQATYTCGGGGGGAGGPCQNGTVAGGGNGAPGINISINGTMIEYGCGGGSLGDGAKTEGNGGCPNAGNATNVNGVNGTGSGAFSKGNRGGNGVVIIAYPTQQTTTTCWSTTGLVTYIPNGCTYPVTNLFAAILT